MRLLKLAVISVIILFAIVTGISLFIPSQIRLSKVITIKPEKDSIFHLIKNKDQWPRWHPSFINGANNNMLFKITAKVISENDSTLLMQWSQENRKILTTGWQLSRSNDLDPATLQWFMDFKTSWYPWEKFGSLFYENTYGVMMQEGLSNIKEIVER